MRQIVSVEKGGSPCSKDCPFYTENGIVRGVHGVPLPTHCRATMETIIVDCEHFNPHTVEKLEVTDEQWRTMQASIGKRARKERKLYPADHAEIHPVGCEWTRARSSNDRWNATKSSIARK